MFPTHSGSQRYEWPEMTSIDTQLTIRENRPFALCNKLSHVWRACQQGSRSPHRRWALMVNPPEQKHSGRYIDNTSLESWLHSHKLQGKVPWPGISTQRQHVWPENDTQQKVWHIGSIVQSLSSDGFHSCSRQSLEVTFR